MELSYFRWSIYLQSNLKSLEGGLMKHLVVLILASTVVIFVAKAETVGPIERDNNGNILKFNYEQAISHCEAKGSRLPTAQEYAEHATALGAREIREKAIAGYSKIEVLDSEGRRSHFYYNYQGYEPPESEEDIDSLWFWSSSVYSRSPDSAYLFVDRHGLLAFGYRHIDHGVHCIDVS